MQYGGNPQQQRLINMMMAQRQQQQQQQQQHQHQMMGGYPWQQRGRAVPAEPTFVTSLTENDVLLGRGTPCAENEGNVRFRRLVKQRKVEYIAAEKRMRKDAIAREILEVIASRGGKFLRKVESQAELLEMGVPPGLLSKEVWAIVDEDTQVQKVKQALRNKDDAAELMASAANNKEKVAEVVDADADAADGGKFGDADLTNRFPRGVVDDSDIHKADCNLQFPLEPRSGSPTSVEVLEGEKKIGSPKQLKVGSKKQLKTDKGLTKSPGSSKAVKKARRSFDAGLAASDADLADLAAANRRASMNSSFSGSIDPLMPSPVNRRNLLGAGAGAGAGGMVPGMRRQLWDQTQSGPNPEELRTLQELQRLRLMREQAAMGAGPIMGNVNPGALGLGGMDARPFGSPGMTDQQLMMNAEYRQMQAQQAQMQQMAAAREQAAMAASRQRPSFNAGMAAVGGPQLPSAVALAARQLQMETNTQSRASAFAASDPPSDLAPPPSSAAPTPRSRSAGANSNSAGERAIGIAQAMKHAEAFSPTESLEISHMETLILSVLCSHGLPVWTPEAHTKSFVTLPTFAKRLDWTWYGFASVLKQKASTSHLNAKMGNPDKNTSGNGRVEELTLESTLEYQRDPRELATKTIMLMEKLRRHCDAAGSSSQRKHAPGLGMQIPLWLDRELSRWAMTLDVADPTGRPAPFSSADFVAEHAEYEQDPALVATAAFDPPLADDVVEQVALLSRLRSVFVKTKGRELRAKLEGAVQKAAADGGVWEDQPKGWDAEPMGTRDLLLVDRLLSDGFSGVLTSTAELGAEYQLGTNPLGYPAFASLNLAKSSIQQRANQIARELHIMEEQKDLHRLRLDRMERLAQTVLSSNRVSSSAAAVEGGAERALNLLATSPHKNKRKGSITGSMSMNKGRNGSRSVSPVDAPVGSNKKQKTTTKD